MPNQLHIDRDHVRLKRMASYYFSSERRNRGEVATFSADLQKMGRVATIGGFLRDVYLAGNRRFQSDVDFVIDASSLHEFDSFVEKNNGSPNRFGGYSIRLGNWDVDVWPLQRTWAAVQGYVDVRRLEDLTQATFFDWDAVLFSIEEQKVICSSDYFEKVRSRILGINLAPNPNPLGNAIRALRYAQRWNARLSANLAEHVLKHLVDNGWATFVEREAKSYSKPVLHLLDGDRIGQHLRAELKQACHNVKLPLTPEQ